MNLLIVGFFRSGTTFLSNILNSHPNAHCVVDPFINFVKLYRNSIKIKKKIRIQSKNQDLENFILEPKNYLQILEYIKNTKNSFKDKITKKEINFFDANLKKDKKYQHKKICNIKKNIKIKSYKKLLIYYLSEFYRISKIKKKIKVIGTKISWCEEYLPIFHRSFRKLKIIYIIRDLRNSISSALNSHSLEKSAVRPILYYILYWKKSVKYSQAYKEKMLIIKYEDLQKNYEKNVNKVLKYCNLKKLKIKKLNDQYGNNWINNSSFQKNKRKKLGKIEKKIIDFFCYNELKAANYRVKKISNYKYSEIIKDLRKIDNKKNILKKYKNYLNHEKIVRKLIK